jgi:hypothetical protein
MKTVILGPGTFYRVSADGTEVELFAVTGMELTIQDDSEEPMQELPDLAQTRRLSVKWYAGVTADADGKLTHYGPNGAGGLRKLP